MKARVTWVASSIIGLFSCAGTPPPAAGAAPPNLGAARSGPGKPLGLRVSLSKEAKSVCVLDEGCAGAPKGTLSVQPLPAPMHAALAEALVAAGLQLVDAGAERELAAEVEWRGTDTIALRLQDTHGHLIDQASFKRSLGRCRELSNLSWENCWAANFDEMKAELTGPLRQSPALLALARKAQSETGAVITPPQPSARVATSASSSEPNGQVSAASPVAERLVEQQVQNTILQHRQEMERDCWAPARDSSASTSSSSARVSVSVTIAASGEVADAVTTDAPAGYPELAPCIVAELRRWRFPAAKKSSSLSIPFVFTGE